MGQISSFYRVAALYAPKRRSKTDKKAKRRKKMSYEKFLNTPYWAEVRKAVFERRGCRCASCGAQDRLEVHHKTYAHRGDEMRHLEDLMVYCHRCHALHHGARQ